MTNQIQRAEAGGFLQFQNPESLVMAKEAISSQKLKIRELPFLATPKGGTVTWEIPTLFGPKAANPLEVIVLAIFPGRGWWAEEKEESEGAKGAPPDCGSVDGITGHGNNREDQNPSGRGVHACLECPWSRFGSNRKGGNGQDCQDWRILLVLEPNNLLPSWLKVSPTSIAALKVYSTQIVSAGVRLGDVVTRIQAVPAGSGNKRYALLQFSAKGQLSAEEQAKVQAFKLEFASSLAPSVHDLSGFRDADRGERTVEVEPASTPASSATAERVEDALGG
jgi:hypothetical protein